MEYFLRAFLDIIPFAVGASIISRAIYKLAECICHHQTTDEFQCKDCGKVFPVD